MKVEVGRDLVMIGMFPTLAEDPPWKDWYVGTVPCVAFASEIIFLACRGCLSHNMEGMLISYRGRFLGNIELMHSCNQWIGLSVAVL